MSKRSLLVLLSIALTATVSVGLTSCGDDPDPVTPTPTPDPGIVTPTPDSTPTNYAWPTWTDINGKNVRLLSMSEQYYDEIDNYFYTYDQAGHLSSVFGDGVKWTSQNTFTIKSEYDDGSYTITVTLNNDGLISTLIYEEIENDGEYEKATVTYTYNSNKQLIRINDVGEWSEDDGDDKGTYSAIEDYTWSNGNLTATLYSASEEYYDEGVKETEEDSGSSAVTYSSQQNPTRQFPYALAYEGIDASFPELAALGLFGIGPKNLPSSATWSYSTTSGIYFIYALNNNGTIASEKYYYYNYNSNYTYNIAYNYGDSTDNGDNGDNGGGFNPGGGNNNDDIYKKVPQKQKLSMPHRIHRRHTTRQK
ncbi:MAG: hypothetical protein IJ064_01765 [Bacteroidaceae bacterium]|nr:hypothetical protein [Bacteroidaceae bacterium]